MAEKRGGLLDRLSVISYSGDMALTEERLLDFMRLESDRPLKVKELSRALGVSSGQYPRFRTLVRKLVSSGELVRLKRGRIGLPDKLNIMVGVLSVVRSGTGYVAPDVSGDDDAVDILIPSRALFTAFDGDRVMVRLTGQVQGRQAGEIISIVERSARRIVGLFKKGKQYCYVVPDNPRIHRDIFVPDAGMSSVRDGDKVVAELVLWDDPHLNPEGKIVERLGRPNDPGVDMLTVIRTFGLPQEFSDDILREAEAVAKPVPPGEVVGRTDLTGDVVFTIDPADAKDHDDAISIEKKRDGYRLGVHIADVSHYVKEGTSLDTEAFARGTSVYIPGMVIPMLPEILSNDVCSLGPNRRRFALTVHIDFDKKGKMKSWLTSDTIIRSRAKLSYEEVQEFFDSDTRTKGVERVVESLLLARKLANLLSKRRFAEGSLDFDLPESKIVLGPKGEVLELGNRLRLESHRLVEEFMLAANRAIALLIFRAGERFLYRVHQRPDIEKLENFSYMMSRLGHKFPVSPTMKPAAFARFLEKTKDTTEADFINELMLRSMQKAVYQSKNLGHFGLAFSHYGHFTSPIRRYPDLFVHRLVRHLKNGSYPVAYARKVEKMIDRVGKHCSAQERIAESAERQAVKVKQVAFMSKQVGEEYGGVISGVVPHGFFVRLDNMGVEGMVRVSSIEDDYYRFDERNYRIVGLRGGRVFRMGDAIRVSVVKVDKTRNEIDLQIVEQKANKVKRKTHPGSFIRTRKKKRK